MKKGMLWGGVASVCLVGTLAAVSIFQTSDLGRIQEGIEASYGTVEQLSADEFATLSPDDIVVFDVRARDEFAVSHIPDAILVDPSMSQAEFELLFADLLLNKRAIFYCSVGVRSTILADRVAALVETATGKPPVNLVGGLFQWHNDRRELVNLNGTGTDAIHPFDDYWGRLIDDQQAISYSPAD